MSSALPPKATGCFPPLGGALVTVFHILAAGHRRLQMGCTRVKGSPSACKRCAAPDSRLLGCSGSSRIAYTSIIHTGKRKIVEKKLRTQIFRSESATFSVFRAVLSAFLQNHRGKSPSKPVRRIKHESEVLSHPPSHRTG